MTAGYFPALLGFYNTTITRRYTAGTRLISQGDRRQIRTYKRHVTRNPHAQTVTVAEQSVSLGTPMTRDVTDDEGCYQRNQTGVRDAVCPACAVRNAQSCLTQLALIAVGGGGLLQFALGIV